MPIADFCNNFTSNSGFYTKYHKNIKILKKTKMLLMNVAFTKKMSGRGPITKNIFPRSFKFSQTPVLQLLRR